MGPVGFRLEDPYYGLDRYGPIGAYGVHRDDDRVKGSNAILILPAREAEEPRAPIEMVNISAQVRPAQRAVLKQVTQPDGTVRTIITSEPIDAPADQADAASSLDRAWKLVKLGDFALAAEAFLELVDDEDFGSQAMLGYAAARAGQGDAEAARNALQRALEADPAVLDDAPVGDAIRDMLADLEADGNKN
jgi:tetratricopeptide (TPR) repeat protein